MDSGISETHTGDMSTGQLGHEDGSNMLFRRIGTNVSEYTAS